MSGGKGSTRRPRQITAAEEAERWAATFGRTTEVYPNTPEWEAAAGVIDLMAVLKKALAGTDVVSPNKT